MEFADVHGKGTKHSSTGKINIIIDSLVTLIISLFSIIFLNDVHNIACCSTKDLFEIRFFDKNVHFSALSIVFHHSNSILYLNITFQIKHIIISIVAMFCNCYLRSFYILWSPKTTPPQYFTDNGVSYAIHNFGLL